jgi:tight adherence protein B
MGVAILVFVVVIGIVLGAYVAITRLPESKTRRQVHRRLLELGQGDEEPDAPNSVVARQSDGPLPIIDRIVRRSRAGSRLARLIEQSGVRTTPSAIAVMSLGLATAAALVAQVTLRMPLASLAVAPLGLAMPVLFLIQRRSSRLRAFEEQFPDALDLISRAIRAGHAFQTAVGMAADELAAPAGVEFKKVFEEQNFGLPVREALEGLAERVPLLDVKFFITAVGIQRDTGGNLAEILNNLSAVVRERFKIMRQVRVHTAHGRITGFVLLALPAFLAVALSFLNPEHMKPLFQEQVGHMLLWATIVMQMIGFIWIRQVIKIEV